MAGCTSWFRPATNAVCTAGVHAENGMLASQMVALIEWSVILTDT